MLTIYGRMLLWTFDVKKKAIIIVIRGLGFEWLEGTEYITFANGRLWTQTCEMVIDISERGIIIIITDSTGGNSTKHR